MKTTINSLLIAFALVSSLSTLSQANPINRPGKQAVAYATSLYTANDGRLVLSMEKQAGNYLTVRVNKANGKTLLTQQVAKRQTSAQVRFDLSQLPDGEYTIEVSNGEKVTTHQVSLNTASATPADAMTSRQIALN